ncbi:MAG: hypothetical protein JWN39_3443 [Ilumatobacteraceae bacterium]|nr:hypothetical protein [Ilumatobacteraceae bacterium]
MQIKHVTLAFAASALLFGACSSNQTAGEAPSSTTAVAITTPRSAATTTAAPATTTTVDGSSPEKLIADCIEFIPIGAILGQSKAADLWNFVGQDASKLRDLCSSLIVSEPSTLDVLSSQLAAYRAAGATPAASAPASTEAPVATFPAETSPPIAASAGMPDVVCMNLQDAQDLIQSVTGVFYSRSFDATGASRMQIVDSNWVVVSQDPAPGTSIGEGDANLGAVKYGETADC